MVSRGVLIVFTFIACAWIFGASLSCQDQITHNSLRNSSDPAKIPRQSLQIPKDNNTAREIRRNNNVAQGESITRSNRRFNIEQKAKPPQKLVDNHLPFRRFTNHFVNYFENRENKSVKDLSHKFQRKSPFESSNNANASSHLKFKPSQIGSKFNAEFDGFPPNNIPGKIDLALSYAKGRPIRRQIQQRAKRFRAEERKSLDPHSGGGVLNAETHLLKRREVSVNNNKEVPNNISNVESVNVVSSVKSEAIANPPMMQEVKIATVLPLDNFHPFSIKRVRPAIELAIEKINPIVAHHNRYLSVRFRDSKCDIADGINECINFYVKKEMHVLFGPCCDYTVAPCARQVVYWNIPMITPGGLAGDFGLGKDSMYSTMTRVGSNFNTLVQFFVDVLGYFNWKKLKLVYDPYGQTNISTKFCHIAANDIHYGLREIHQSKNITQTYVKFEFPEKYPSDFQQQIGLESAG